MTTDTHGEVDPDHLKHKTAQHQQKPSNKSVYHQTSIKSILNTDKMNQTPSSTRSSMVFKVISVISQDIVRTTPHLKASTAIMTPWHCHLSAGELANHLCQVATQELRCGHGEITWGAHLGERRWGKSHGKTHGKIEGRTKQQKWSHSNTMWALLSHKLVNQISID